MTEKNLAQVLREQMRAGGKRFWAGDNISDKYHCYTKVANFLKLTSV